MTPSAANEGIGIGSVALPIEIQAHLGLGLQRAFALPAVDTMERRSLAAEFQDRLGQLLRNGYEPFAGEFEQPTARMEALLQQLATLLTPPIVQDEKVFKSELLALMPNLNRFALSLTKNRSAADDLVQDTFLKAWRSRAHFELGTNLGAWLFTIMRNTFYSKCRKQSRMDAVHLEGDSDRIATLPEQMGRLNLQDVRHAIDRLSPDMRQALLLVVFEGKTYDEAAEIMRCQVGTIKSRVWRARDMLVSWLKYDAAEFEADHIAMAVVTKLAPAG